MEKQIYTASYAMFAALVRDHSVSVPCPIAISRSIPDFFNGMVNRSLAPSAKLLKEIKAGKHAPEVWKSLFRQEVALRIRQAYEMLPKKCTILCWESDHHSCHRSVVYELMKQHGAKGGEIKGVKPQLFGGTGKELEIVDE